MFGSLFWIIYGILAFIAFIGISLADNSQNKNIFDFVDSLTIVKCFIRLIMAILWLPLLIIFLAINLSGKVKDHK